LTLTNAASVDLEPIWANLLAKALEGKNIKDMLSNVGSGGGGPAAAASAPSAGAPAATTEAPKEEAKEEEKEESDEDMVCLYCIYTDTKLTQNEPRALVSSTKTVPCRIINSH